MNCIPGNRILDNSHYRIRQNIDFWEHRADYVFAALLITGIFLLALGACMQASLFTAGPVVTNTFLGIGGAFFGLGALMLLARGCNSR